MQWHYNNNERNKKIKNKFQHRAWEQCNYNECFLTDSQVKLLQSLGIKSTLITDGSTPINLFNTAHGLMGALPELQHPPSKRSKVDETQE